MNGKQLLRLRPLRAKRIREVKFPMLLRTLIFFRKLRLITCLVNTWILRDFRKIYRALAKDLGMSDEDINTVVCRSKSEGIGFFTKTLPKLGKDFDLSLSTGKLQISPSFSLMSRRRIPHFLGAFFRKVFTPSGMLLSGACPLAIRAIRQVCYLLYKVPLAHSWASEKRVAASFVRNEVELASHPVNLLSKGDANLSAHGRQILARASQVIYEVFKDVDIKDFRPKHSSGSVVGGYSAINKTSALKASKKPWSTLGSFITPFASRATDLGLYPTWRHRDYFTYKSSNDASEVLFVPKDSRGPRLICREPAAYQYLQQGFMVSAVHQIQSHPISSGRVNFTRQDINQEMAKLGSVTRKWSTLDLKDASDRNSCGLVLLLWARLPELLGYMMSCRTSFASLYGKLMPLEKFAPMGSALCFPVMAINIFAILVAALSTVAEVDLSCASKYIYVYGDDIICPSAYADALCDYLHDFGFVVNREKSFIDSRFTESCGTDWFDGENVTPIRLKSSCLPTNEDIVSRVASAKLMTQQGYHHTAEALYVTVELFLGSLPFGTDRSPYLARLCPEADLAIYNFDKKVHGRKAERAKGWFIKPVKVRGYEEGYAHLERVLPMLGSNGKLNIPQIGEYTPPRRFALRKKCITNFA